MIAEIKNTGKILSLMFKSSHLTEAYNKTCLITLAIELSLKSRFWIVSSTNRFSALSCLAKKSVTSFIHKIHSIYKIIFSASYQLHLQVFGYCGSVSSDASC